MTLQVDLDLSELEDIIETSDSNELEPVTVVEESPISSSEKDLTLHSKGGAFSLSLRVKNFGSEKDMEKFIKCVERLVRYSIEYKHWHSYITDNLGYDSCALTEETMSETKIEIHHHPISLFTVCKAVINKHLNGDEDICSFDIATEVIELHFKNKIGYVALLSNLHEKYHNGYLEIPIELVHGDYMDIVKNYTMDDCDLDKITSLCQVKLETSKSVGWAKNSYPGTKN